MLSFKEWNGQYWERTTLGALGFVLSLGHNGHPCPRGTGARTIHILDTTGIHDVKVSFCKCGIDGSRSAVDILDQNQLLCARIFPATVRRPESAATFACLNVFHILTTQGKITGMDFYETLVRLTDNIGKDPPNVRLYSVQTIMIINLQTLITEKVRGIYEDDAPLASHENAQENGSASSSRRSPSMWSWLLRYPMSGMSFAPGSYCGRRTI